MIAEATEEAIRRLRVEHREDFCIYALVTSGEAYRPHLAATVHDDSPWNLADSPYALVGDEILARTEVAFTARGRLHDMDATEAEEEYWRRLTSMEEALRTARSGRTLRHRPWTWRKHHAASLTNVALLHYLTRREIRPPLRSGTYGHLTQ